MTRPRGSTQTKVGSASCTRRRQPLLQSEKEMISKNTICLWYDDNAMDAARFYAETFPDSAVGAVMRAPGDYPDGKQGDVLTVEFTVAGIPCIGLNGGPTFKHNEAFSFQIATEGQAETDRLWNAIVSNGGPNLVLTYRCKHLLAAGISTPRHRHCRNIDG